MATITYTNIKSTTINHRTECSPSRSVCPLPKQGKTALRAIHDWLLSGSGLGAATMPIKCDLTHWELCVSADCPEVYRFPSATLIQSAAQNSLHELRLSLYYMYTRNKSDAYRMVQELYCEYSLQMKNRLNVSQSFLNHRFRSLYNAPGFAKTIHSQLFLIVDYLGFAIHIYIYIYMAHLSPTSWFTSNQVHTYHLTLNVHSA